MADQLSFAPQRVMDANATPVAGAKAYFYKTGTNISVTVYQDAAGTVPHASPVVADSAGVFPQVFSTQTVKVNVTDSSGTAVDGFPIDPALMVPAGGTGAAAISFSPTTDIPSTNVQDAIEKVQANIVAPLADYGIGVTGNADTLADIDATNIASGFYRFETGASGTFPSGVTAADGGVVYIVRETASAAHMTLIKNGETAIHHREMSSSTWGSWATVANISDVTSAVAAITTETIHVQHRVAAGTASGDYAGGGVWTTRPLTTVITNTITGASLASNQVTLPAGTYKVRARSPMFRVNQNTSRIYDVTNAVTLLEGSSTYSNDLCDSNSWVEGQFALAGTAAIAHQAAAGATRTGNAFGHSSGYGSYDIYGEVIIEKIA